MSCANVVGAKGKLPSWFAVAAADRFRDRQRRIGDRLRGHLYRKPRSWGACCSASIVKMRSRCLHRQSRELLRSGWENLLSATIARMSLQLDLANAWQRREFALLGKLNRVPEGIVPENESTPWKLQCNLQVSKAKRLPRKSPTAARSWHAVVQRWLLRTRNRQPQDRDHWRKTVLAAVTRAKQFADQARWRNCIYRAHRRIQSADDRR